MVATRAATVPCQPLARVGQCQPDSCRQPRDSVSAVGRQGCLHPSSRQEDSASRRHPLPAFTDSPPRSHSPLVPEACLGTCAVLCGLRGDDPALGTSRRCEPRHPRVLELPSTRPPRPGSPGTHKRKTLAVERDVVPSASRPGSCPAPSCPIPSCEPDLGAQPFPPGSRVCASPAALTSPLGLSFPLARAAQSWLCSRTPSGTGVPRGPMGFPSLASVSARLSPASVSPSPSLGPLLGGRGLHGCLGVLRESPIQTRVQAAHSPPRGLREP